MIAQDADSGEKLEQLVVEEVRELWGELMATESGDAAEAVVLAWSRKLGQRVLTVGMQARVERLQQQGDRRCGCGGKQQLHSRRQRVVVTMLGTVRLRRQYRRCVRCGRRSFPADEWLGWKKGFSHRLQEAVAWQAAALPYRQAVAGLRRFCGVELSLSTAQQIVACWGSQSLPQAPYGERVRGRLVVEIDGTKAHLEDGWREVKLASLLAWRRGRAEAVSYVADWLPAEQFAGPLWREALVRGAPGAREVAVIGDGAPWIWETAATLFPRATEILDWYHLTEHLWEAAKAIHGEGSEQTKALEKQWETEVWEGRSEGVEEHLRELAHTHRDPEAILRRSADYVSTHQARLRYPLFRQARWPVGSGVVEGGCKYAIDLRFKRKSTKWTKPGARAVLNLRLDILNRRWEQRCDHLRAAA